MPRFNKLTLDCEMVLGKTGTFSFSVLFNGEKFLKDGDVIYFTLKKIPTNEVLIEKKITEFQDGHIVTVPLLPDETENMEEGNYMYDLVLERADGNKDMLMPKNFAYFTLKRGVR